MKYYPETQVTGDHGESIQLSPAQPSSEESWQQVDRGLVVTASLPILPTSGMHSHAKYHIAIKVPRKGDECQ